MQIFNFLGKNSAANTAASVVPLFEAARQWASHKDKDNTNGTNKKKHKNNHKNHNNGFWSDVDPPKWKNLLKAIVFRAIEILTCNAK